MNSINLIPKKDGGLLNQFLNWALTVGRLLIIITQTLALSVFIYRFTIDMKIVDLHDEIKNQSFFLKSFEDNEKKYRNLQERLSIASGEDENKSKISDIIIKIIDLGKNRVTFVNIAASGSTFTLEVQGQSSNALNTFVEDLKRIDNITAISISSVENKTSKGLINMSIIGQIKK